MIIKYDLDKIINTLLYTFKKIIASYHVFVYQKLKFVSLKKSVLKFDFKVFLSDALCFSLPNIKICQYLLIRF